jgi:hypothetical protein
LAPGWSFRPLHSPASLSAFTLFYTPVLAEIADALRRDGKASEGLSIIDEALARSDSNEERWCVAELLRINGELILLEGTPQAATVAEENLFAVARMGTPAGRPVMGAASVHKPCACSGIKVGSPGHAAFCSRCTIASARVLRPKTAKAYLDSLQ